MNGKVFGVGVGPGDSELLTVKAVNAIKGADVIIAPRTEKKEGSVALDIARCYIGENTEIVYQIYPMVKGFSEDTSAWEKNKAEIMAMLEQGKQVVFLTLGDPMFYSTYIYVYNRLKEAGANIETIPGIPAFCAIASYLGRSIVEGDDILSIIPATVSEDKLKKALATCDNAVIMKVYKNFSQVVDNLDEASMLKNATLVSRCGLPDEVIITDVAASKDKKLNYLSTILTKRD